jgi:V/A-type H+-transporting ATPase subunit E
MPSGHLWGNIAGQLFFCIEKIAKLVMMMNEIDIYERDPLSIREGISMKTLEKGQEKIQKICDVLREETLEPAKKQGQEIIRDAQKQAKLIIEEAQKSADKLHLEAKAAIEQEKVAFQSTLSQASKQTLEALRQGVERLFFNEHLAALIDKGTGDAQLVANLVNAIVKAIEKGGLSTDLTALISKDVDARKVNEALLADVVKQLKGGAVQMGEFSGGVQVKLNDKRMTIDISEHALKDLLASYVIRKDFRKLLFDMKP